MNIDQNKCDASACDFMQPEEKVIILLCGDREFTFCHRRNWRSGCSRLVEIIRMNCSSIWTALNRADQKRSQKLKNPIYMQVTLCWLSFCAARNGVPNGYMKQILPKTVVPVIGEMESGFFVGASWNKKPTLDSFFKYIYTYQIITNFLIFFRYFFLGALF